MFFFLPFQLAIAFFLSFFLFFSFFLIFSFFLFFFVSHETHTENTYSYSMYPVVLHPLALPVLIQTVDAVSDG
jgi:hypothetical protein